MARCFDKPIRVLYIDSDIACRDRLTRELEANSYPTFIVHTYDSIDVVPEVFEAGTEPQVLMMDMHTPWHCKDEKLCAFNLCAMRYNAIPLILLSARDRNLDLIYELVQAGADNVFIKSRDLELLVLFLVKALARHAQNSQTQEKLSRTWQVISNVKQELATAR
jgi:DNA-binding response OmpR family regulator